MYIFWLTRQQVSSSQDIGRTEKGISGHRLFPDTIKTLLIKHRKQICEYFNIFSSEQGTFRFLCHLCRHNTDKGWTRAGYFSSIFREIFKFITLFLTINLLSMTYFTPNYTVLALGQYEKSDYAGSHHGYQCYKQIKIKK